MEGMNLNKISSNNQENKIESLSKDEILRIIQNAPELSTNTTDTPAPFAHFHENTDQAWKYVPHEAVENYLKNKLFFDTSSIPFESKKEIGAIIVDPGEETIKIPTNLVVRAIGFNDWRGRPKGQTKNWTLHHDGQTLSGYMPSIQVNKLYASIPSKLPAVSVMRMYIQPDKKIFFDNVGGDSHRIAAAILRGNKNIETKYLIVYKLDSNYL